MNDAFNQVPAKVRKAIYLALAVVSLLFTATGAVYALSPWPTPWWIAGGLAGVGVLAAPFGVLALVNVSKGAPETVATPPAAAVGTDDESQWAASEAATNDEPVAEPGVFA